MVAHMRIRPDILRTYQSIHTWTGITTGLLLFIAFFAGAITMFKPQIEQWATPPAQALQQVPTELLDSLIQTAINNSEKAKDGFIISFNDNDSPIKWYEKGGGRGLRLDDHLRHASFNDDGDWVSQASSTNELGTLIDQLHRTAGIIGKIGHEDLGVLMLGIAAVLYFLALISGIIVLMPTLVKNLFALRQHKGVNRFWLDSHNLVGVISLPFHLIIAWTVVVFAFHDLFYGGLSILYGDKPLFEPRERSTIEYSVSQLHSIDSYIAEVTPIAEGYQITSMEFSKLNSTSPSLAVELQSNGRMMRGGYSDFVYMHPYTMEVQYNTISQVEEGLYGPIVNSIFALHFGNYAGSFGRWIYFSLGLLGAFLFYSGNLLWLEKRRQKQAAQRKATKIMASLTIGVCLGSMLGVAVAMLATKWLYLLSEQINSYYLSCYYIAFFAALAYSFVRGAALAAISLLRLLSLCCLLIPVTSLVALLLPHLAIWTAADIASLTIEAISLIFALLFYIAAKKAHHRAYFGEPDSIWAVTHQQNELKPQQNGNTQVLP